MVRRLHMPSRMTPTGPQRRAILACFQLSTWDWVRLADLLRALVTDSEALDAIGGCIARGWLDYDIEFDVVRTNSHGRDAAGLLSGFPRGFR
jgi:hypothetical protein